MNIYAKFLKYSVLVIFGLIAAFFIAYYLIYLPLAQRSEKQQFAEAKVELTKTKEKLVASIGKPDQEVYKESCRRQSAKFNDGALYCTVSYNILYENKNEVEATALIASGAKSLDAPRTVTYLGDTFVAVKPATETQATQEAIHSIETNLALDCSAQYLYGERIFLNNFENPINTNNVQISISCTKHSKGEYFPLEK